MAYKIVEFNDGIQLVPNNWLSSDGYSSYWPPSSYNQIKINKSIANNCEPNIETWSIHSVLRIFGSSGITFIVTFIILNLSLKN